MNQEQTKPLRLGDWNELRVVRLGDHGALLDGGEVGEVLMPRAYVGERLREGDVVRVFLYFDQSDRLVATTETPLARAGEFAWLRCAWVNEYGAFLHWGLMKDLFVPFREQKMRMEQGRSYLVYVCVDPESGRLMGSAKVERWLRPALGRDYWRGCQVELLIQHATPLGLKCIVDGAHPGLIYRDQIYGPEPHAGDRLQGTVVQRRMDGRLDISLQPLGKTRFRSLADTLLEELQRAGGTLELGDDSSPEEIAQRLGVSKKTFKRALGTLLREGRVELLPRQTRLICEE